jgi:hypothetical protein
MRVAGQTGIWLRTYLRVRQVCVTSGLAWRSSKRINNSSHKIDSCPRTLPSFVFASSVLFFFFNFILLVFFVLFSFLPSILPFFIVLLFPLFLSSFHTSFPSFVFHFFSSLLCLLLFRFRYFFVFVTFSVPYLPPPYFSVVSLLPLKSVCVLWT